tara:strand:+ start:15106 stop:15411 length:306 start_codon:yes stop_codon:yes gene_type:complete
MTDIPWGEQPTEEHCWLEEIESKKCLWVQKIDHDYYIYKSNLYYSGDTEGEYYTIHRKEPKALEQVFIEKAMNLVYEGKPSIAGVVGAMYDAGFKAPEGDL